MREVEKKLEVGDSVTWTKFNFRIPLGSIGVITRIMQTNLDDGRGIHVLFDDTDVQSGSIIYILNLNDLVPSISKEALDMRAFYLAKTYSMWDHNASPALFYGRGYPDWVNKDKEISKLNEKMHDALMDEVRYNTLSLMLPIAHQNGKQAGELAKDENSLGRIAHGKMVAGLLGHCLDKFVLETPSFIVEVITLKDHAMQHRHTFDTVAKEERQQLQTTRMEVSFYFSFLCGTKVVVFDMFGAFLFMF